MDFYNNGYPPAIDFELADADTQLYVLLISSQYFPVFMYVHEQDAVKELNRTLTEDPNLSHPCHSDNTANDPAGTIRHPVFTVDFHDSQLELWDVSLSLPEQKGSTWSTLVWNCNMAANEILQPIGHLSVVNVKDKE